jgi:hypothetical protein
MDQAAFGTGTGAHPSRPAREATLLLRVRAGRCAAASAVGVLALGTLGLAAAAIKAPARAASVEGGAPIARVSPFLIYYGWIPHAQAPFARLAAVVAAYPVVVLGSGDEWVRSGDLGPARALIRRDGTTRFYGYVDIGVTAGQPNHTLGYVAAALDAWHRLGARGVLLDCAGPDYGVDRARRRAAVALAHRLGLAVLLNAFSPLAALGVGLGPSDAWLAENWAVADGRPVGAGAVDLAGLRLVRAAGIAIWMTATGRRPPGRSEVVAWVRATIARVGGTQIAVAGPNYSSVTNRVVPAAWIEAALARTPTPVDPSPAAAARLRADRRLRVDRPLALRPRLASDEDQGRTDGERGGGGQEQ